MIITDKCVAWNAGKFRPKNTLNVKGRRFLLEGISRSKSGAVSDLAIAMSSKGVSHNTVTKIAIRSQMRTPGTSEKQPQPIMQVPSRGSHRHFDCLMDCVRIFAFTEGKQDEGGEMKFPNYPDHRGRNRCAPPRRKEF